MEKTISAKMSKSMPNWYIPAWSTRAVSIAVSIIILNQITFYSTEVLGLNIAVVGTVFLVAKIFDAMADLFVGYMIDKVNFKGGKGRPYELLVVPLWILIVMFFSTPNMGQTSTLIYIFIVYTLITSICQTTLQASETVFLGRAIVKDSDRGKLLAISGVIVMLLAAVASMLLPNLMVAFGNEPGGWTKISLIYAIPMMLLGVIRYFTIREVKVEPEEASIQQLSLKESIKLFSKNKYIFILSSVIMLANAIQNIMAMVGTYYFTYILGNLGLMGLIGLLGLAGPFILLLFPIVTKKVGAVNFIRIGLAVSLIASGIRFFFPTNVPIVLLTVMFTGIGASGVTMLNHYFILQCIDYGELKFGKRIEGLAAALNSFTANLGQGVSAAIIGVMMGIAGYMQSSAVQTDAALFSIKGLYTILPGVICLIMLILLHFFDVEKQLDKLRN